MAPKRALRLYNTLGRRVEELRTHQPGKVGMYCCGPTVYEYQHIGNFRTYILEDVLRRALTALGYEVRHVMNVTDVGHLTDDADEGDDKMLQSARREGKSAWDIAAFYTEQFFRDSRALNILEPHVVARATNHIDEMIELIERLESAKLTYEANGNVFYDVAGFDRYGELALLDRQDLRAGARIDVDSSKRNPEDFGLWFTRSKFERQEMLWDSPWGRGYPGWHIECSAMAMKYLGETVDIHCGGIDHVPVHHTNEIAQSEGAIGLSSHSDRRWVSHWCHGEFLIIDSAKMSKSKGNLVRIDQLVEQGYEPLDYRYFVLGAHYRKQQNFTAASLEAARSARLNLVDRLASLASEVGEAGAVDEQLAGADGEAHPLYQEALELAASDLSMPRVLEVLWRLAKEASGPAVDLLAGAAAIDGILGLGLVEAARRTAAERDVAAGAPLDGEIRALVDQREKARQEGDYATADRIRDDLAARGVELQDTPEGVRWRQQASV